MEAEHSERYRAIEAAIEQRPAMSDELVTGLAITAANAEYLTSKISGEDTLYLAAAAAVLFNMADEVIAEWDAEHGE